MSPAPSSPFTLSHAQAASHNEDDAPRLAIDNSVCDEDVEALRFDLVKSGAEIDRGNLHELNQDMNKQNLGVRDRLTKLQQFKDSTVIDVSTWVRIEATARRARMNLTKIIGKADEQISVAHAEATRLAAQSQPPLTPEMSQHSTTL